MNQWKQEIEKKTDGRQRVLIHHGPNRTDQARKLQKYHVVITSYNTLSSEWVDPKKGLGGFGDGELDEVGRLSAKLSKGGKLRDETGPLFDEDYTFYRGAPASHRRRSLGAS